MNAEEQKKNRLESSKKWKKANKEKVAAYAREWYARNKDKSYALHLAWQRQNRIRVQDGVRNRRNRTAYNLTVDEYQKLLIRSHGRCEICNRPFDPDKKEPQVYHNHQAGAVRGLLCGKCNRGLGQLNDSLTILQNAVCYLKNNQLQED